MTTRQFISYIGWTDNAFLDRINGFDTAHQERLYLKAKDEYYKGTPFMSDHQFDLLEEILKKAKSKVVNQVGGSDSDDDKKLKHKHWSPMLSLDKQQVNDENNFPLAELSSWANGNYPIEATPKYDGNAIELQYDGGKLLLAVTRGKNGKGQDVTSKLKHMVPQIILSKKKLEIRGEVVMATDVFNKNYLPEGAKHPRNTVAGILNRDDATMKMINDCTFVAYSLKMITDNGFYFVEGTQANLTKMGFNSTYEVKTEIINGPSDFRKIYDIYKKYRGSSSRFTLDGIVLKMNEKIRASIGDTSHHPKWALAVKFPSKEAQTRINSIEWNVGYTGEFTPVGILEPVDLDGSTITKVSLYNKNKIEELGMFPGALVSIKRSGDIIPMITEILTPSPKAAHYMKEQNYFPKACTSCGSKLHFETIGNSDAVHIMCKNDDCASQNVRKLSNGLAALEVKGIGESTCVDLYNAGVKNLTDFFNPNKMNEARLISSGVFQAGRSLEIILECPSKLKEVDLYKAIHALQFKSVGSGTSKEIAKMFVPGLKPKFEGKEKAAWEPFTDGNSDQSKKLREFMDVLKGRGIKIIYPSTVKSNAIGFEMTGSPASAGYKIKEELVKYLQTKGYNHVQLKEAQILLTDSHSSSSSKMKDAKKKGIKIMTYDEILNKVK